MSASRFFIRLSALKHKTYVRTFSGLAPYLCVNEFPKSGGTWLAQMLSEALEVPFRRNAPIRFENSIAHGHFLSPIGLRNVIVLWRDPRDLIVSYYFHCYFTNEHHNFQLVKLMKERCPFDDYHDIRSNLPTFIHFITEKPVSPGFNWPEFVEVWAERSGTIQTSYEKLRQDTPAELTRIFELYTGTKLSEKKSIAVVEKYDFSRVKDLAEKNLPSTAECSFAREGAIGGWRKHFTVEALESLKVLKYNKAMVSLGYEPSEI